MVFQPRAVIPVELMDSYVTRLNEAIQIISTEFAAYLAKCAEERKQRPSVGSIGHMFKVGDYVLITYPSSAPSKLAPIFRGPLLIQDIERDDIYVCLDLLSKKQVRLHRDRLRYFHCAPDVYHDDLVQLAMTDTEVFWVESILEHRGRDKKSLRFHIRWSGLDPSEDT